MPLLPCLPAGAACLSVGEEGVLKLRSGGICAGHRTMGGWHVGMPAGWVRCCVLRARELGAAVLRFLAANGRPARPLHLL